MRTVYRVARDASGKMARPSDADLTAAIIIAVILITIALVAWPGFVRVRPRALAGYWASQENGALFEVRPGGGRALVVSAKSGPAAGATRGLRGVRVATPGGGSRDGRVELGNRRITWEGGDVWSLQGVR